MGIPGSYSREMGQRGFDRIADTKIHHADHKNEIEGNGGTDDVSNTYHPKVVKWTSVKLVGTVVFAAGTEVAVGDVPGTSDSLPSGDIINAPFTKIQLSSGVVYAYRD